MSEIVEAVERDDDDYDHMTCCNYCSYPVVPIESAVVVRGELYHPECQR